MQREDGQRCNKSPSDRAQPGAQAAGRATRRRHNSRHCKSAAPPMRVPACPPAARKPCATAALYCCAMCTHKTPLESGARDVWGEAGLGLLPLYVYVNGPAAVARAFYGRAKPRIAPQQQHLRATHSSLSGDDPTITGPSASGASSGQGKRSKTQIRTRLVARRDRPRIPRAPIQAGGIVAVWGAQSKSDNSRPAETLFESETAGNARVPDDDTTHRHRRRTATGGKRRRR